MFLDGETWLGQNPKWLFTEPEPEVVLNRFRERLQEIETIIDDRNKHLKFPYTILKPSTIPAGVSI